LVFEIYLPLYPILSDGALKEKGSGDEKGHQTSCER
jgi:hypothetical protein